MIAPHVLRARATALGAIRDWFQTRGYLEVMTSSRVPSPAMEEHLYALPSGDRWLRTSPEFALKKVLAAGLPRIYEIGPCWRDREKGPWHATEFTMIEWYRAGADLTDLMDEVESLLAHTARALGVTPPHTWRRTTVRSLFLEHTGSDLAHATVTDLSEADEGWDDAFFRRWVDEVEPRITTPLIVAEWPASQAALAQVRDDGPWPVASRFEVFLGGVELANAFQELTDANEQLRRFASSAAQRVAAGEAPHPVDAELIEAVGRMPRTAGIAMGLDRLVAVQSGWSELAPPTPGPSGHG